VKVKLKQGRVGVDENGVAWSQDPGDEIDVPNKEGAKLVDRKIAVEVKSEFIPPAHR
jgi:hypothetical protein